MASLKVPELGDYLKEQRQQAKLSLRQLAEQAGVSNPYLSQVERGLRRPSAEVLQQIAKGLRISAEALYIRAGILEDRGDRAEVEGAVMSDPFLSERQRRVLLDIYQTFRAENDRDAIAEAGEMPSGGSVHVVPAAVRVSRRPGERTAPGSGKRATEAATTKATATKAPGTEAAKAKAPGAKAPATKAAAKRATAKRGSAQPDGANSASANSAGAKKTSAKKASAKRASAKRTSTKSGGAKNPATTTTTETSRGGN